MCCLVQNTENIKIHEISHFREHSKGIFVSILAGTVVHSCKNVCLLGKRLSTYALDYECRLLPKKCSCFAGWLRRLVDKSYIQLIARSSGCKLVSALKVLNIFASGGSPLGYGNFKQTRWEFRFLAFYFVSSCSGRHTGKALLSRKIH